MKLDLNLFTNFCSNHIDDTPLFNTIESLHKQVGLDIFNSIKVFCHHGPFIHNRMQFYQKVAASLVGYPFTFYYTRGLADGYLKSIQVSDADYLFQFEHDWVFIQGRLRHDLLTICQSMQNNSIPYVRFNRFPNQSTTVETLSAVPDCVGDVPFCKTTQFSNNPHLLDREHARLTYMPLINIKKARSSGIEENITRQYREGWIYGDLLQEPVILHTDGKKYMKNLGGGTFFDKIYLSILKHRTKWMARFALGHSGRFP
ncbi:MAG: hypothetical protein H7833_01185 [Magnetococcus sp. DMHC-1]